MDNNELNTNELDNLNSQPDNRSDNLRKLSYIAKNDKELFSNIHNR